MGCAWGYAFTAIMYIENLPLRKGPLPGLSALNEMRKAEHMAEA